MSQTAYNINQAAAILGMLVDSSFKHTESMINNDAEALPVGRAVMRVPATSDQVRLVRPNYGTVTVSADLDATSSSIITVDGTATTATVYASSHAATMAAIVVKVAALATVAKAWLDTTNNKIIHIIAKAAATTVSGATTVTAQTWAATQSFLASDFFGIAQLSNHIEAGLPNTDSDATYPVEGLVNVLRRGRIWVNFETAFDPDKDTLYVRNIVNTGKYIGQFGNVSDSSKCVSLAGLPIRVLDILTAAGMGRIEINLP
jgi:hypothetical protein